MSNGTDCSRRVSVIGAGYVGLVSSVCLAELGHQVTCIDNDPDRVSALRAGDIGMSEPDVAEWLVRNVDAGRLTFTSEYDEGLPDAEFALICVDTPVNSLAEPDLRNLRSAATDAAQRLRHGATVVLRSTVPPGTTQTLVDWLKEHAKRPVALAVQPEFFQEGRALKDCWNPVRIVVGSEDPAVARNVARLWEKRGAPVIVTDTATAEMVKQASNAFLATKISFINDIAGICDAVGADIDTVAKGMGYDPRIGSSYLRAGIGFGGSCLPKDLRALIHTASRAGVGVDQLAATLAVNERQRNLVVQQLRVRLGDLDGRRIAIFGLAFKPDTSDLRDSPATALAARLVDLGVRVVATDPAICPGGEQIGIPEGIRVAEGPYAAAENADAVVVATEWGLFTRLDWLRLAAAMAGSLVIDGRNCLDAARIRAAGLDYAGIGRAAVE